MSKCHNINTAEFQALKQEYGTDAAVGNIIDQYQDLTKTESIPTVAEAIEMLSNKKAMYNLKQLDFGQSLLNNLRRLSIIHSYRGTYFINNTDQVTLQPSTDLVESNKRRLVKYLEANNIPIEAVDIVKARIKKYKINCDLKMGYIYAALHKRHLSELYEMKDEWSNNGYKGLKLLEDTASIGIIIL